ncbi:MAG: TdeIII family type II restriction endonuclease [Acidobacteria bacterium]|nr:TdeIII family type II restriction endonuclease [Acidobacteriota bacterium]
MTIASTKDKFNRAEAQYVVGDTINQGYQTEIQSIMNALSLGTDPDKPKEIDFIRNAEVAGKTNNLKTVKVDLFLESFDGEIFLFDLKTAKPNISNFKDFKQTLLLWAAIAMTSDPNAKINSLIAIPYNPYEPQPYQRWTMKGMLDLKHELKVAGEFWDFLGGEGAYVDLLDCFERAGIELRSEVDDYFAKFKNSY